MVAMNEPFKSLSVASLCLLSVVAITVNATCLVVMRTSTKLSERPSTCFIINLLVVDLLQGVLVFPLYAIRKQDTKSRFWEGVICNCFRFLYMLTFYMSILCVLLIALDRYIATTFVFGYKRLVKLKTVTIVIIVSWIYAIGLCIIPFFTANLPSPQNSTYQNNLCDYHQSSTWTITMLVLNCFLPYLVILFCYKYVIKHIRDIEVDSGRVVTFNGQNAVNITFNTNCISDHIRSFTTVSIIITICYAIFWTPSVIYYVLTAFCSKNCFSKNFENSVIKTYLEFAIKYLAFLNSVAAPIIYCFVHKEFRRRFTFLAQ